MAAESRLQVGKNTTPKCPDVSQVSFVTSSVPSVSAGWLLHRPAGRERRGAEGGRAAGGGRGRICLGATGVGGAGAFRARSVGSWFPATGGWEWYCSQWATPPRARRRSAA